MLVFHYRLGKIPRPVHIHAMLKSHEIREQLQRHNLGDRQQILRRRLHPNAIAHQFLDPCIPATWKEFQVSRRWRQATFEITVKNPRGVEKGVTSVTLNGNPVSGAVQPQPAGSINQLIVTMG